MPPSGSLITVDWGLSSLKAWLLNDRGEVVESLRSEDGTASVARSAVDDNAGERAARFEAAFLGACGRWLDNQPSLPVVASGMVGSETIGWIPCDTLDLPADLEDLALRLTVVPAGSTTVHIVPGLRSGGEFPDVIRGEEAQILGLLLEDEPSDSLRVIVLPGAHTKWVAMVGTRVIGFSTAMTGEIWEAMFTRSLLSAQARASEPHVPNTPLPDDFYRGLNAITGPLARRGLSSALATARALVVMGELDPEGLGEYVSGLLIGDEVQHLADTLPPTHQPVHVCAPEHLGQRYVAALSRHGLAAVAGLPTVGISGLWHIASKAGLLD